MSLNPDIAMINAAAVKVPQIPEGNISVGQIFSLIPYKNVIAVLNIKGKNIRKSLEHGVHHAFVNDETGGFPYTAGLRYKIVKDGEKIFKVENIEILTKENSWVPLDDNMIYRMATYTYLINGGNGYTDLKDTSGEIYDSGITDIETFMDYLIKNKSIRKLPDANISTNF
jgi:5'-nucleotidase